MSGKDENNMSMNGIDVSGWQKGIDLSKVPADFVIIKATQGTSYVNSDCDRAYQQKTAAITWRISLFFRRRSGRRSRTFRKLKGI